MLTILLLALWTECFFSKTTQICPDIQSGLLMTWWRQARGQQQLWHWPSYPVSAPEESVSDRVEGIMTQNMHGPQRARRMTGQSWLNNVAMGLCFWCYIHVNKVTNTPAIDYALKCTSKYVGNTTIAYLQWSLCPERRGNLTLCVNRSGLGYPGFPGGDSRMTSLIAVVKFSALGPVTGIIATNWYLICNALS